MSSKKDETLTTEVSRRMLDMVSPIYDNSYVFLWILEVIGREYATVQELINELPRQLDPSTATWLLEVWEQRYKIVPGVGSIQDRRNKIALRRGARLPMNPARLKATLELICGAEVRIDEHIGDYTFGVFISDYPSAEMTDALTAKLNQVKPAHLSYTISYEQSTRAQVIGYGTFVYGGRDITMRQVN